MYRKYTSAYFKLVMDEMESVTSFDNEEDRKAMGNAIRNIILKSGPTTISRRSSRKDKFIASSVFQPVGEIINTISAIENIEIYIRRFPYAKQGISQLGYLRYHVENYLYEIYILKERLLFYLKILEKSYRKSSEGRNIQRKIKPLYSVVSSTLKQPISVRNYHVHVHRISNQEFDRLSTLELLSKSDKDHGRLMRAEFISGCRKAKKEWAITIKSSLVDIHKLLEIYFCVLSRAVFRNGRILIPDILK